jgi:PAS domain S-box-containing protein
VLDSASETSVIATDPGLVIKVFNAGAAQLLGYSSEEVIDCSTLWSMHDPRELRERAGQLGAQLGRPLDDTSALIEPSTLDQARDWIYVRKDGTHVTVSLVVSGMYAPTGELVGYTGVAHDVTRQKQYEESLRDATQKAENANRAKSQFLANMSHEIRTPMNAVIGLSYLLAESHLQAGQRELLSKIQVSSKSLLAIINDVLDLTKIEAAELIVECSAFSPYGLLQSICDVIAMQAQAKGIAFDTKIADDLPIAVLGDPTRLSQILTNLLANAVKFTDRGGVTLQVTRLDDRESGARLCFVVRDTGIGISSAAQAHLFMPFSQADASITRRFGGTGLGLSIVKSLAKLLGGEIALKSIPGVGSEFTVTLTFAPAAPELLAVQQADEERPGEDALSEVRVLLVDDSDINLDVTKRILELHGAEVEFANNGLEACECLRERPFDFDVVLMDVQMPLLDGYQATRRIRTELGLVDMPIIALTAGALSSERARAVAAGMDDFITKPFDAHTLTASILRHVRISVLQSTTPNHALSRRSSPSPVASPVPWPAIAGIDSTDARLRLCDDFELFLANLKRLLVEFSELSIPDVSEEPGALLAHAARMHKLSGIAGMLGANAIQQLALDARGACEASEFTLAQRLAVALNLELRRLSESAEPVFEMTRKESTHAEKTLVPCDVPLKPEHLAELIHSLRQESLSALYRFDTLSPQLQPFLGVQRFDVVREHMENLRFIEASKVLADGQEFSGFGAAPPQTRNNLAKGG